jgi:hypothetical protein
VSFRPGSRDGVQRKTIQVETNDPSAANLVLEVSAHVEVALAVSPPGIMFPAFAGSSGSAQPQYARLSGSQAASVNVTSIECPNKLISVEVNRSGFDGDPGRQVKFSVRPGMPAGRFRERVVLRTDSATVPELSVFVTGEALGAISVTPRHLSLGTIQPGAPVRKLVRLQATQPGYAFRVADVQTSGGGITAELVTVTPGSAYEIAVGLAEGFSGPVVRGEIVITTDDASQGPITVRVFGRIASGNIQGMPAQPFRPAGTAPATTR